MFDWTLMRTSETGWSRSAIPAAIGGVSVIVGVAIGKSAGNGSFGPAATAFWAQLWAGLVGALVAFALAWIAAGLVLATAGKAATLAGTVAALLGIGAVVIIVFPSPLRQQALDCWETEFRMLKEDRDWIASWMDGVEEQGISWSRHECTPNAGGTLSGIDDSGDHRASIQAFSGYVENNVFAGIKHQIDFECTDWTKTWPSSFVRACVDAMGDQDYLEIFDAHEAAMTEPEAHVVVDLEAGSKFRDWHTAVRLRTFGAFVHHFR